MMSDAHNCLKSDPCDVENGCKEIDGLCVYNKKKCFYDKEAKKCRQKCELFKTRDMCDKTYCNWNNNNLKCTMNN